MSKMKKQKNLSQLKEQEKSPERKINEIDIDSLLDQDFKKGVIELLKELKEIVFRDIKYVKNEIEAIKKSQVEWVNSLTEMRNDLIAVQSRLDNAEERISDLEDRAIESTHSEELQEKQIKNNENSIRDLWDNIKRPNLRIIGVPEGEERSKGIEKVFEEIMTENFPNLKKESDIQVQEAQRVPNRKNPNRPTPRHIIIKMARVKDKERILKAAREKQRVSYKGTPIRLSADFSTQTLQARREWQDIFKALNEKKMQPRILYPARLSLRIEGEIKSFTDKKKLQEFSNTKPMLKEILKGLF